MFRPLRVFALSILTCTIPANAHSDNSAYFGVRESVQHMSMSPDGTQLAFIQPSKGQSSVLLVAGVDGGVPKAILKSDGEPWRLTWCGWASNSRLVCELFGIADDATIGHPIALSRLVAVNSDGTVIKQLGQRSIVGTYGFSQFDGEVVGWPASDDGQVVMTRQYREEMQTNTRMANKDVGLGVDLVDTTSLKSSRIESPRIDATGYIADGDGVVRIIQTSSVDGQGLLKGVTHYYYRSPNSRDWKPFSRVTTGDGGLVPVAIDSEKNIAYAFRDKDGRKAIFTVGLGDAIAENLLLAHDKVDVTRITRFGRSGRVIGAQYVTDKREFVLFDDEYKNLAARLGKALPGLPLVHFVDASRDETRLLLFAGSDADPGRYYVYNKTSKKLNEVALVRPELETKATAKVSPISYPAADGSLIPGYLTLPPGSDGKGLPAIVMPHGGPSARDEWGFDWWAQYYAAQGYAVLQPNFRGSAGYGDDWYVDNGFKSWRIAVGDVNDAGKWLISQGIAVPSKLAIVGWSYGGYAALQSGALDPNLFKAVVAIAPVTDLKLLIDQSKRYTNSKLVAEFVGSGEHLASGSPVQQVAGLKSPILMFSGDKDLNVDIAHARAMEVAARKAGKMVELITYKGLDHQLDDSAARIDMLQKSDAFLKRHLNLP